MALDIEQIKAIIPHRYPFLLVDRIEEFSPGQMAKGYKCVSANEMQFLGHFPNKSIFPGVLIVEALAQVGAIAMLTAEENKGKLALFGGIKQAKFREQVVPGDILHLEAEIVRMVGNSAGIGKGKATVNGKTACEAEFSFALIDG